MSLYLRLLGSLAEKQQWKLTDGGSNPPQAKRKIMKRKIGEIVEDYSKLSNEVCDKIAEVLQKFPASECKFSNTVYYDGDAVEYLKIDDNFHGLIVMKLTYHDEDQPLEIHELTHNLTLLNDLEREFEKMLTQTL